MKGQKGLEAFASRMRQDFFQPLTRDEIPNSRQHGTQSSDVFSDQSCFQTSNLRAMNKQHLPWLNTLSSIEKDVWCFVFLELHLDATHCWEINTSC